MKQNFKAPGSGKKLSPPADTAACVSVQRVEAPAFVRLPRPGTLCPFTGLSRTQMYLLCKTGKVKSFSLKRKGTARGCRLIDAQSLIAVIQNFAASEGPAELKGES
jgi:hypothetical protein